MFSFIPSIFRSLFFYFWKICDHNLKLLQTGLQSTNTCQFLVSFEIWFYDLQLFLWLKWLQFHVVLLQMASNSIFSILIYVMPKQDLMKIFEVFTGQIRQLFGLKSDRLYMGTSVTTTVLASERGFTEWYAVYQCLIWP